MSKTAKVVLIIAGVCITMCVLTGLLVWRMARGAMITDPVAIRAVGAQIAEFEVPAGHREQHAMDMMGMKMVLVGPEPGKAGLTIMLMQFGMPGVTREQMESQMSAKAPKGAKVTPAGKETVTIRGKPVELQVFRRDDGSEMRQGIFEGRGGPAMINVSGPASAKADAERFLRSIK